MSSITSIGIDLDPALFALTQPPGSYDAANSPTPPPSTVLKVGEIALDWAAPTASGETLDTSSLRGKPAAILFWPTCGGCLGQTLDALGATLELACHGLIRGRCTELRAMESARTTVEARYLDGAPALFPALHRSWDDVRANAEQLAAMAARLAELDGDEMIDPPDEPTDARLTEFVADLVEPAKVTALEQLGEGAQAQALAIRWLRPRLVPEPCA